MKAVLILMADSPDAASQAAELDQLLEGIQAELDDLRLWLLHGPQKPMQAPAFSQEPQGVDLIRLPDPVQPENILHLLEQLSRSQPRDLYLFGSGGLGEELAARLGHRLGGTACLQVSSCVRRGDDLQVEKPAYAGSLSACLKISGSPVCLTAARMPVRPAGLIPLTPSARVHPELSQMDCAWVRERSWRPTESGPALSSAPVVLAIGAGAGNKQNIQRLKLIAERLGAELGGSRQAVMNGWLNMDRLIGISGHSLAPGLCIAAGVSGSGAFSAGVKNSGLLVAVNQDDQAPIFDRAQVGVHGEMMEFLLELVRLVQGPDEAADENNE